MNIQLDTGRHVQIQYPSSLGDRNDMFPWLMLEMSSVIPETLRESGIERGINLEHAARFYILNAGIDDGFFFHGQFRD